MNKNWQEWLASNHRGWRLVVGLTCVFFLALFLHFREVRLDVLELNTVAGRHVVAELDFEYPDYETTLLLKQQASQDIGHIYHIQSQQIRQARYELEEDLIHNKEWRKRAPSSTFEEMYKASDELETLLLESRLTDPRTIQKVRELQFPDTSYFEYLPESTELAIVLPQEFWDKIKETILKRDIFHRDTVEYAMSFFQKKGWYIGQDRALERNLKGHVARTIPDQMSKVFAGSRLINPGERVLSRHLTMMHSMKEAMDQSRQLWTPLTLLSSLILAVIFVTISALYFRISNPTFIRSLREISLFVCIILLTLLFAKTVEYILLKSTSDVVEAVRYPIIAPFATILICILLSPRAALFAATFLSILLSISLAVDQSYFLVLNLVTSIVVIISCRGVRKRKEVFTVCMKSWLSAIPVLYAFTLSTNQLVSPSFLIDTAAAFVFFLITAVLVVGLLPALETLFGILTDMTLMEYTDPNSDLLRRFALEVPGTYQHSLVLGNLAESCAQAIGAGGLFCRAATLYHDIGKMNNPQFYTENQQGAVNIHQLLTPLESAQVIMAHVTDGEAIARKAHLPQPFIDIIREHHGTTLVYYFYRKQLELKGGRVEEVDERQFRYPGPKPRTKESAIIMICDSVEAAARSIEEIHETSLTELVDRLIAEKAKDGQFDNCRLTFEELSLVKQALVKTLLASHHVRVKYPKRH